MKVITSFAAWLSENHPETTDEIYSLYRAVEEGKTYGLWDVSGNGVRTFVTGPATKLLLANDEARKGFLVQVDKLKDDDQLDMHAWYQMKCGLK